MKPMLRTTILAGLMAGVALTAAVPLLAQNAQAPMAGQMQNGAGPMAGQMQNGLGPMDGAGPMNGPGPMAGPTDDGWPKFDLKSFDTDGDGKVTLAEIQAKRADEAKSLDANGDGKLSEEELVNAELAKAKVRIEERVKARIAAQDADGDGMLSAAELALPPAPERMFERLDANNDGAISADEIAAAQARMQDRMGQRMGPQGDRGDHGMMGHRGGRMGNDDGPGRMGNDDRPGRGGPNAGQAPRWMWGQQGN